MAIGNRARDHARERRERDSFILLLHLYNLSRGEPNRRLGAEQVTADLAFDRRDAGPLIDHLGRGGYVERHVGNVLAITEEGIEYIERGAWRRRSARVDESSSAAVARDRGR